MRAQSCVIDGPRYNLNADTVDWPMKIASGRSCVRGVRYNNVAITSIKIVTPPQSGKVTILGSGFAYAAPTDFSGKDTFSLAVFGAINNIHGNSTINVTVSVGQTTVLNTTPPTISFISPANGATVSGSQIALTATASDNKAVAQVQFIIHGRNLGSPITATPYTTIWNSTEIADGTYTLYAVAKDTSGNYATSSIRVTVENAVPRQSPRP